jgi:hypothetical protein
MAGVIAIGCSLVIAIPQTMNQVIGTRYLMKTSDMAELLAVQASGSSLAEGVSFMPLIHNFVQGFLVISLAVLALMMAYEMYKVRKNG